MGLDPGEAAAIGLASTMAAPILIDERIGRQVALARSLRVIGSIGVLLLAKQRGFSDAIGPLIDEAKAADFFISAALQKEALRRTGEV